MLIPSSVLSIVSALTIAALALLVFLRQFVTESPSARRAIDWGIVLGLMLLAVETLGLWAPREAANPWAIWMPLSGGLLSASGACALARHLHRIRACR